MPEVRLVGDDGKQIGVVKTSEALAYAQERDLDLVEVAPDARPPVCRALDYSKFKYEQAQKLKAARKHQQQITIREIKFRPKIAQNDYDTKKSHVTRFLLGKDKVKITIMFRGREVTHPERGTALLDRLAGELSEIAVVEQTPIQDGRNMTMMLAPSKAILAGERDRAEDEAPAAGAKRERREVGAGAENGEAAAVPAGVEDVDDVEDAVARPANATPPAPERPPANSTAPAPANSTAPAPASSTAPAPANSSAPAPRPPRANSTAPAGAQSSASSAAPAPARAPGKSAAVTARPPRGSAARAAAEPAEAGAVAGAAKPAPANAGDGAA